MFLNPLSLNFYFWFTFHHMYVHLPTHVLHLLKKKKKGVKGQSVSHSHRHMAELLQLEHALGGKLQHLHR